MRKIVYVLVFICAVSTLVAQEKQMLPTEIKANSFLLKFRYDRQNRIIERYFENEVSAIKDSIVYKLSERKCVVYSLDKKTHTEKEYTYVYGKKREEGQWLKAGGTDEQTSDYFFDSDGYLVTAKGWEWDGSWNGGPCLFSYKYQDGNLTRFSLDSKKQQADFIESMNDWEKQIFDEVITYDTQKGIFSQVNPSSQWLLVNPAGIFYPMLHLNNNALKIERDEQTPSYRDFDEYPPVEVTYKYKFNKYHYPQNVDIVSVHYQGGKIDQQHFSVSYQDANTVQELEVEKKHIVSDKKLLPKSFFAPGFSKTFTYDNQNRFTSIKEVHGDEVVSHDTIMYYPDRTGYKKYSIIHGTKDNPTDYFADGIRSDYYAEDVHYKRVGDMIIFGDEDGNKTEFAFTPSGMLSMMKTIDADYDPKTSIDPPVIIGFIYDEKDNLIDMYLPNNASGDRVNRNLQMIEYEKMNYDDMNGIFKHVNRDCFMILYNQSETLTYYYFMGNNLLSMEDEYNPGEYTIDMSYKYNKYDYPIRMNHLSINYIDAH